MIRWDFCALGDAELHTGQMLRWTAEDAADESYMWRTHGATEGGRGAGGRPSDDPRRWDVEQLLCGGR